MPQNCNYTTEIIFIVVTAVLAIITALVIQHLIHRKEQLSKRIAIIANDIHKLKDISTYYWTSKLDDREALILEERIKSKLSAIQRAESKLSPDFRSYKENAYNEYVNLKKTITGGLFETRPKPVSMGKIQLIEQASNELECTIRNSQKFL